MRDAPPNLASAIEAAEKGDESAARYVDGWSAANAGRERLAEILARMAPAHVEEDGEGRSAVREVVDLDTGELWELDGRMIREDWLADPRRTAQHLQSCGTTIGVLQRADGTRQTFPWGCTSPICPVCARSKAGVRAERWAAVVWSMVKELGCEVLHLTLTQKTDPDETLTAGLDRLKRSWKTLVDGRGSRREWKDHVAGYLLGTEWTGRNPKTGERRWHPHFHVAVICWPGMAESFERFAISRWCDVSPGSDPRAQHVTSGGLEDTIREVLKYPFKPVELDDEQIAEVLVSTKGLRPHRAGGGLHGASRVGKLVAALDSEVWDRVHEWKKQPTDMEVRTAEAVCSGRRRWEQDRPRPIYRDAGIPVELDEGHHLHESRIGDWIDAGGRLWRLLRFEDVEEARWSKATLTLRTLDGEPFELDGLDLWRELTAWSPRKPQDGPGPPGPES